MEPGKPRPVLRQCVACKKLLDRKQLLKVTRDYQNGVVLENGMGRSAYLCPNENCIEESWRRKRLQKALRCQVSISVIEVLQKRLKESNFPAAEAK